MKVLMIDNYDSFPYNLVQYLGELDAEVEVVRNDQIGVDEVRGTEASHIMVSPGPCTPNGTAPACTASLNRRYAGSPDSPGRLSHVTTVAPRSARRPST